MRFAVGQLSVVVTFLLVISASAQQRFSELVGPVNVQPVRESTPLEVPFITWGGDVATFHANGGLVTKPDTEFAKNGLNLKLVPGDDFLGQVKNYLTGRTPFLRGTMRMLGQASEVLGSNPSTKPVVVLQLSWSAGDHIVARKAVGTLNDLRGKKIACQQGGPHVGLLYDSINQAGLTKDDVQIVWVPDLTGDNGPAETFRKDSSIDACCVITPDMIGLTGGMDSTGTGAEGTVQGARVLNSTQQMSQSIADVYAVRADWYRANRETVEKFVAGYLRATEEVVTMRDDFEAKKRLSTEYRNVLTMAQSILGKDVLPTLELDAHGLLLDCRFARLPGQIAFFEGYVDPSGAPRRNPNGFDAKMNAALDLAQGWGYAARGQRLGFDPPGLDYQRIASLSRLKYVRPTIEGRFDNIAIRGGELTVGQGGVGAVEIDPNTIFSFEITYPPNEREFSVDRYGAEFRRAIESASTFGDAVVVIRGHSDPSLTLINLLKAGLERKTLKRVGQQWFLKGKPLDLSNTEQIVDLINRGAFNGVKEHDPRGTMQAALNLSNARAQTVKDVIVRLATQQGVSLDETQFQPVGVGISEPVVPVPQNVNAAAPNRRVEFRIVKIPSEAIKEEDFDLLGGQ